MTSTSSVEDKKHHHVEVATEQEHDIEMYNYSVVKSPSTKDYSFLKQLQRKVTTRDGWIGTYDYSAVCMPRIPFFQQRANSSPFYGPNDEIPILVAIIMGVQHFLAVIGGIITPTLMVSGAGASFLNLDSDTRQYMVSASLIVSGLMSMLQIIRFKIPKTRFYIGAGLLQITGVSFANIAAAQALISNMYSSGACPTEKGPDGAITHLPCPDAFGAILGTQMFGALLAILISFLPPKVIRYMFPKIVSGVVLIVIGITLLGSGMKNWAGGSGPCMSRPTSGPFMLCPSTSAPHAQAWGSPINFALGASVFVMILVIELVGSVFLKNIAVFIGLLVGCIIAGAIGMFDGSGIASAPAITFLWVKTFKLSVYGPAVIPYLFTYLDMIIECLGDLTAASDVSGLPLEGEQFEQRCQGGLLADGLSGIFSSLATSMGVVTFSQNNGIIAVTRCASRVAGFVCAIILVICGVFGKISAAFLAIPLPLIGGMTVFLFASVATSGIRILSYLKWTRRDRIIVAASLAISVGVSMVPDWFNYVMPKSSNPALEGFYQSIHTVVSTGYIMAGLLSVVLNLILPYDSLEQYEPTAQNDATIVSGIQRNYQEESTSPSPSSSSSSTSTNKPSVTK